MNGLKLEETRQMCSAYLDAISKQFNDGVKVTLVVRTPLNAKADFILTSDTKEAAIEAIQRTLLGDEPC